MHAWTKVTQVMTFGSGNGNNYGFGAVITASEALGIDSKIDDGKPATGTIKVPRASGGQGWGTDNCATSNDPNLTVYNTGQTGIICSLIFDWE